MSELTRVRLDKWLWAARFFKTRSLAQQAIEGGKVHCEGQRAKPAKEIQLGARLQIRQGFDEREVIVRGLSEQRGPAPVAQQLYEETAESLAKREAQAEQRRLEARAFDPGDRPSKKQRRQISRFREIAGE